MSLDLFACKFDDEADVTYWTVEAWRQPAEGFDVWRSIICQISQDHYDGTVRVVLDYDGPCPLELDVCAGLGTLDATEHPTPGVAAGAILAALAEHGFNVGERPRTKGYVRSPTS